MARIIECYDEPVGSLDPAVLARAKRNIDGFRGSRADVQRVAQAWADRTGVRVWITTNRKGRTECVLPRPRPEPPRSERDTEVQA